MKRDLLKINGYIFGDANTIEDSFLDFIQKQNLYFIGMTDKKSTLHSEDKALSIDGYIFSDKTDSEEIKNAFQSNFLEDNKYDFVGETNSEYDEINF